MRLSAGGRDYIVHLNYEFTLVEDRKVPTAVTARVHEGPCVREIENCATDDPTQGPCTKAADTGRAYCHPKDQFVRATGRKVALGRALRNLTDSKARRAELWADYRMKAR